MKEDIKELEDKIIKKAEEEAETITSRAEKARERMIQKSRNEAKEILENARNEGRKMLESNKSKIQSEKIVDERQQKLNAREDIINQIEKDLRGKIQESIQNGELNEWIKEKCLEIQKSENRDIKMIVREEDYNILKKIVDGLENISIEKGAVEPGFLLQSGNNEYDFRVSTLSRNLIGENRKFLVDILEEENG